MEVPIGLDHQLDTTFYRVSGQKCYQKKQLVVAMTTISVDKAAASLKDSQLLQAQVDLAEFIGLSEKEIEIKLT